MSLDLTIKETARRVGLLFPPEAVAVLADATFLVLLAGGCPAWLDNGAKIDMLTATKLLEPGSLDVDLRDPKVESDLAKFGTAVMVADQLARAMTLAARGIVH